MNKNQIERNEVARTKLIKGIQKQSNNDYLCSLKDICGFLGVSANTAKKYLGELTPAIGKKYLIEDVIDSLLGKEVVHG